MGYRAKKAVVAASLLALSTAFETVSKRSPEMRAEIARWNDGRAFAMGVLPRGPAITMRNEGGRLRYAGPGYHDPDVKILFKNVDNALLPLTGRIGADIAFVQHRAALHGEVAHGMQTSRALAIVQTYLLPGFILRRTFKRPPRLSARQWFLKAWVMGTLPFGMAVNFAKR